MDSEIKGAGLVVGALVLGGIIAGWLFYANSIAQKEVLGVADANADRKVFEQSKSFKTGMIREIQDHMLEYGKANDSQKAMLRTVILHKAAEIDEKQLPEDLQKFLKDLRAASQRGY
jgi:hypothetical protein